jgi:hypothetical protein
VLAPNDRELLLDALRPEPGMSLDAAVGTTFTLDLDALLLAPLAFALFETEGERPDPTALLAAIQQHAERIALYCDAAHVRTRDGEQKLFVLLERTILPVHAPLGGSFHPKLWVLRFRSRRGEMQHRLLVMSRNLTFDTSWDLVARFDEDPDGAPLGESAAVVALALDALASSPVARSIADSVGSTRFAVPEPFTSALLHGIGFRSDDPDPILNADGEHRLIISPFLTTQRLSTLAGMTARKRTLVSRPDELERLGSASLEGWQERLVLRQGAQADPMAAELEEGLRGLHAKLVVTEHGDLTTWFLGSANATTAAHTSNVEAFVELRGPTRKIGAAALLRESHDEVQFRSLLQEFVVENADPHEQTPEELEDARLEKLCRELARRGAALEVSSSEPGWEVAVRLVGQPIAWSDEDRLSARLATRGAWSDVTVGNAPAATLRVARASEITALLILRLHGSRGVSRDLVLVADLIGAPEDRLDEVMLDLVPDARRFAFLMFLMLAVGDHEAQTDGTARRLLSGAGLGAEDTDALAFPLFESLVRASARDPERLVAIDRLITQFSRTEEGRQRLPEGIEVMWAAFHPLIARPTP